MLTLWCIIVAIGSLYFFGLPAARLLAGPKDDPQTLWIIAPFLGLSVIVLVLQNLVYLDVRVGLSTPWLWAGACLLWVWVAKTGQLPWLFSGMPRLLLALALGVYLIQGLGLLLVGAEYYVGRAWLDQFNYTATAQFLMDYPFSLSFEEIGDQPYLFEGVYKKHHRIGQSVFHGFLAVSTLTDAKTMFEPAILLSPLLIMLAVYLLARRLSQPARPALLAAVGAGTLPAITMVHLESFFSQALGIPFLLIYPFFIAKMVERLDWRRVLSTSLVLAAGTSIYTEFYIFFLYTSFLIVGINILLHRRVAIHVLLFALPIVTALLLNAGFLYGMVMLIHFTYMSGSNVLASIYPWAYSIEGIGRLWLGDFLVRFPRWPRWLLMTISLAMVLVAYLGLIWASWRRKDALGLALLGLAALPLPIRAWGEYPYQFYKTLLSISPLLVLGIAIMMHQAGGVSDRTKPWLRTGGRAGIIVFLAFSCGATIDMAFRSAVGKTREGRGETARTLLMPATREVQEKLSETHGQDIYIVCEDNLLNAWLAYFARHNRVWLGNPLMSDLNLQDFISAGEIHKNLPDDAFLLISPSYVSGRSAHLTWSAKPYYLYKLWGRDWALLKHVKNENSNQEGDMQKFFWMGKGDTVIKILAGREGVVILDADFLPGPSRPESSARDILIMTGTESYKRRFERDENHLPISIPVVAGQSQVAFRVLDEPTVTRLPNGDTRTLLLGVRGLHLLDFR